LFSARRQRLFRTNVLPEKNSNISEQTAFPQKGSIPEHGCFSAKKKHSEALAAFPQKQQHTAAFHIKTMLSVRNAILSAQNGGVPARKTFFHSNERCSGTNPRCFALNRQRIGTKTAA